MQKATNSLLMSFILLFSLSSTAQILIDESKSISANSQEVDEGGYSAKRSAPVGKAAATEYFKKRENQKPARQIASDEGGESAISGASGDRVIMLHLGTFVNDKAYRWGRNNKLEDPGEAIFGVTYRVGEWKSSMDLYFRAELMSYDVDNENPLKLSLMPILAFPDVRSDFPLYFGLGAGAGIFFKQAGDESDLSFDYTLLVGARFPTLLSDSAGVFLETGLKGHVHLLSSGQQDGVYISAGALFSF